MSGVSHAGTLFSYTSQEVSINQNTTFLEYVDSTSGVIVHDTNTLSIDDETNAFVIHHQGDIPTDTSVSYDLISTGSDLIEDTTSSLAVDNDSPFAHSNALGLSCTVNEDLKITKVNRNANSVSDTCYITDTSGNILASSSFVGDVASFDLQISSGTTIYILTYDGGASRSVVRDTAGYSFPQNGTYMNINTGLYNGVVGSTISGITNYSYMVEILSIVTETIVDTVTVNSSINTVTKKSGVISKGTLTNSDNIKITCNLATTNNTVTPTSEGFGIVKL